ncbi:DNA-processing protein DprA [Dysgonomonas macrotermitis]|uniref:DNA processing protein n=1 Tax=Dysgonomonas macrotermitis TaxID=1346286 RepID=A0A1M5J0S2_9BACT|nr:DNA-processing protein DprA [Dysgonomonas macrotermitis]SHG34121.1 DNA processing protein [Dysgonomonas macrotermitis]
MNDYSAKLLYRIALTQINGVGDILARNLLDEIGDEEAIFKSTKKELMSIKNFSVHLAQEILNPEVLRKAEKELEFVNKNNIQTFFYMDEDYPYRLKECADAPILLYYKGKADLNARKIISIVGTRKSSSYGTDFCDRFIEDIASVFPDILIVSGLAYGIDIQSHRAAVKENISTVGVLAHGLDRIYPAVHRKTAVEMLEKGGLLTEFISETEPDKFNFVKRNRIVAGMSDATIVVQTDMKGGSLITADLANSYDREVFSVPGRVTDRDSAGCNMLIEQNKAILLQSAESFIKHMQWDLKSKIQPKQQELFLDLTKEEQAIFDLLSGEDSLHVNFLSAQTSITLSSLLSTLLLMEMKGLVRAVPGGNYQLTNR